VAQWYSWVTLGDTLVARRGARVELGITVDLANGPNWAQVRAGARSSRRDPRRGHRPAANRDTFTAPDTKVVKSFFESACPAARHFTYDLGPLDDPFTYGCAHGRKPYGPGFLGASVDPAARR